MPDFAVQATIDSPGTTAFTINSPSAGYELEAGTIEEVATTWRKVSVDNPWAEGSYVVSAVRENESVPVSVWVRGASHQEMKQRLLKLTQAVGRPKWTFQLTLGSPAYNEYWTCQTSDYSLRTQREFLAATICLVKIQVVRLPTVRYVYSTGVEVKQ